MRIFSWFINLLRRKPKWYCNDRDIKDGFIYVRAKTKTQAKGYLACIFCEHYKKNCNGPTLYPKRKDWKS